MADTSAVAERLAVHLQGFGMQRMTARVLCAVIFADQETMTAGEIAERLEVSAGAVSGALKTLGAMGFIERVHVPGSRRDHYCIPEGTWAKLYTAPSPAVEVIKMMQRSADDGIALVGEDSIAGARLAEMRDFYAFMMRELPAMIYRWQELQQAQRDR